MSSEHVTPENTQDINTERRKASGAKKEAELNGWLWNALELSAFYS